MMNEIGGFEKIYDTGPTGSLGFGSNHNRMYRTMYFNMNGYNLAATITSCTLRIFFSPK